MRAEILRCAQNDTFVALTLRSIGFPRSLAEDIFSPGWTVETSLCCYCDSVPQTTVLGVCRILSHGLRCLPLVAGGSMTSASGSERSTAPNSDGRASTRCWDPFGQTPKPWCE